MKITCSTIQDFITNLKYAKGLYGDTIYVDINKKKVNEVKSLVTFQATAIVVVSDSEQYILVAGQDCGFDYQDASKKLEGTERANQYNEHLQDLVCERKWHIRPGVVSE